jgi:hypothetical protein
MTKIPENFQNIMMDMVDDFSQTFPECSELWYQWSKKNMDSLDDDSRNIEFSKLYSYVVLIYPERFFDIIYQNEAIFSDDTINTCFLPGIDFKQLFNCNGISEKTRKVMWNYLKLVLLSIVESVKDKTKFGKAGTTLDDIDEGELLEKLTETMSSMTDFFKNLGDTIDTDAETKVEDEQEDKNEDENENVGVMPNINGVFDHLKSLFDGKIGSLAKELAEEISGDFSSILGEENIGDIRNTKDVINKLLKNPEKIKNLLKTVNDKLQNKMSSGEITQDELMKEVTEIMSKMKENGGDINFQDLFKQFSGMGGDSKNVEEMMKKMGGLASGLGGLGGLGGLSDMMKNMSGMGSKPRKNKDQESSTLSMQDRMKSRIMVKKLKQMEEQLLLEKKRNDALNSFIPYDFSENTQSTFTINGEEKQDKSQVPLTLNKKSKNKKSKNKK